MKFSPALLMLLLFFSAGVVMAQTPAPQQTRQAGEQITDQELKQYLMATYMAQKIYNDDNMKMADTLKSHGLNVDLYNSILNSMKLGETEAEMDATETDISKFKAVSPRINQMQESMEQKIVTAIEANGMALERFDELFEMIQKDAALKVRVEALMKEMSEWNE
jgi:hypothetical protein